MKVKIYHESAEGDIKNMLLIDNMISTFNDNNVDSEYNNYIHKKLGITYCGVYHNIDPSNKIMSFNEAIIYSIKNQSKFLLGAIEYGFKYEIVN